MVEELIQPLGNVNFPVTQMFFWLELISDYLNLLSICLVCKRVCVRVGDCVYLNLCHLSVSCVSGFVDVFRSESVCKSSMNVYISVCVWVST